MHLYRCLIMQRDDSLQRYHDLVKIARGKLFPAIDKVPHTFSPLQQLSNTTNYRSRYRIGLVLKMLS